MRDPESKASESGFSLIELMIALTITMIISGAIYGLLTSGQSAFRLQPERSDRQQSTRAAMDLIMRDIANAGSGAPSFVQAFTQGLDGATNPDPTKLASPFGGFTDELEIITNPSNFPPELACGTDGVAAPRTIFLQRNTTLIAANRSLLVSFTDGTWTLKTATVVATGNPGGAAPCDNSNTHVQLTFNNGDLPGFNRDLCALSPPNTGNSDQLATCTPASVTLAEQVHYRIRRGADTVPNLERRTTANWGAGFQVVARGIEDLQVQYAQVSNQPDGVCTIAAPCNNAPTVFYDGEAGAPPPPGGNSDYNSIITQVTVTLRSRSTLTRAQGQVADAGGNAYLRGSLTSTGTPRAALSALTMQTPVDPAGGKPKWH